MAQLGSLIVNGAARVLNNIYGNLVGTVNGFTIGKSVPSDAKFTDTVTTATTSGSGNAVTAISASNGALTVTKGTTFLTSHQDISGKVSGPSSATADHVATFSGTTGKVVKDSGFTIGKSVPSNAVFTDTDTKVTAVGNHYTPTGTTTKSASGGTATNATGSGSAQQVVTGVTVDAAGHVTAVTSKGIYSTDTTYSAATQSANGLMSSTDKTKLDGIATGATANTGTITGIKMNGASKGTSGVVDLGTVITAHQDISGKAPLASPALTGTPTAPTAAAGTNTTQIATTAYVMNAFQANDAMVFKGTIGSSGATVTALPATHYQGWTYKVITAGTYAGATCEIGDMIICITDGTSANDAHWTIVQSNIDGAVTGPSSSTAGHIVTFSGTTGKVVKDSGYTIAKSVPSNAVFTDHITSATTSGSGNAVTAISADANGALTITKGTTFLTSHQDISGKVSGPSSATNNAVAIFDGTGGKTIKNSGYTIGKSVPSDAVFTDTNTTYTFSQSTNKNGIVCTPSSGSATTVEIVPIIPVNPSTTPTVNGSIWITTS